MIIQAINKNEPKMSQKMAKKGIVNRVVVLTLLELLLLTLILLSCQKEKEVDEMKSKTAIININSIQILAGDEFAVFGTPFILSGVNGCVIKSCMISVNVYKNTTGASLEHDFNLTISNLSDGYYSNGGVLSIPPAIVLTKSLGQIFDLNLFVKANTTLSGGGIVRIPSVSTDNVTFDICLIINYEEIEN